MIDIAEAFQGAAGQFVREKAGFSDKVGETEDLSGGRVVLRMYDRGFFMRPLAFVGMTGVHLDYKCNYFLPQTQYTALLLITVQL